MDFKTFWKESLVGLILKRLILAILIFIALAWIALLIIDQYTHHGESVPVPDLQGLYIEEAESILKRSDLKVQIIDSIYVKGKALGAIVEQIPSANSHVKKNRSIFVIVNRTQVKTIPLPDLNDVSLRQAEALLKSLGLEVSGIQYNPSEFKDLVIDVLYRGRPIISGTRLTEGSRVELIVGSGMGDDISLIPSLIGLNLNDARFRAMSFSFILGSVSYDIPPVNDEHQYLIYKQTPQGGQRMAGGARINVWMTKDRTLIEDSSNSQLTTEQEEEFF